MGFTANEGKQIEIKVQGDVYCRHAIRTHFVSPGESYINIVREYVLPLYVDGDILSISEKIISMCQNRIIRRKDLRIGFWAKSLSALADRKNPAGCGVGNPAKMQYAINKVGLLKVLWASFAGGLFKLFGKKGIFYKITGPEVSGLDGFFDGVWTEYGDMGIEIPVNSHGVCNAIKERLGITCMIVDANDLGQEILGKSEDRNEVEDLFLKQLIRDNPAGQGKQQTPLILIRKKA